MTPTALGGCAKVTYQGPLRQGEIVAAVALNTFTNYFNSVGETTLDFPAVDHGTSKLSG